MLLEPAPARFAAPRLADPGPPPPPPLIAILVPVLLSGAMWAITGSAYSLLFAAAAPLMAVGSIVESRRQRRRQARHAVASALRTLARLETRIAEHLDAERRRLERLAPSAAALVAGEGRPWADETAVAGVIVTLGRADVASGADIDLPDDAEHDTSLDAALEEARERVGLLGECPVLVDAHHGIDLIGPEELARAAARAIAIQIAATLTPRSCVVHGPAEELWLTGLPHRLELDGRGGIEFHRADAATIRVSWAARDPAPTTVRLMPDAAEVHHAGVLVTERLTAGLLSRAEAARAAAQLCASADQRGLLPPTSGLPSEVMLSELLDDSRPLEGLGAPIGRDANGAVWVDLVGDGPHAVIAGTTGSGKSELLISWVLGMADRHPPRRVTFLLIDFKGGAAFAPLIGLAHVVGMITDLDDGLATRAIGSLRAELRQRERVLAELGRRSIDDAPVGTIPRLVVVIDEFAAMVAEHPELHELVADLAARGRSLGLHLILCTQRPAGVIRDAVLANAGLRISLRVTAREDSVALLRDASAAELPAEPRGRAVVALADRTTIVQVARAREHDRRRADRHATDPAQRRPWVEPPAALVRRRELPEAQGLVFGLSDRPDEQRLGIARYVPSRDGHLLVLGGARSGTTTALAAIGAAAGDAAVRIPGHPADAWAALTALLENPDSERIVLLDDLDVLLERAGDDRRLDFHRLLSRLMREQSAARSAVCASVKRPPAGAMTVLAGFGSRLLLGMPSRDEHVIAGGAGSEWRARRPGAALWRGREVQIAGDVALPQATNPRVERCRIPSTGLAVVSTRAEELASRLRRAAHPVLELDGGRGDDAAAAAVSALTVIGDPEAWQSAWAVLTAARRAVPFLVDRCSMAELRAVTRVRESPPLDDTARDEAWLVTGRTARRVLVDWDESSAVHTGPVGAGPAQTSEAASSP